MRPGLTLLLIALVLTCAARAVTTRPERNLAGSARPAGVLALHVHAPLASKRFQTLYSSTFLDGVVDGISGLPLTTVMENDPLEWASLYGRGPTVLGFVCVSGTDPNGWCYHRVFLGPTPTATFVMWLGGQMPTYWDAAAAIMTVTHEATHYQKASTDEGRVNACALQQFPGVIDRYFQIHPTVAKTVAVRKHVWRAKRVRVRRLGRLVSVVKRVRQVVVLRIQRTVPNPDYVNLVQAARLFYASQPPPYSTGTCF